ncbi:MAG: hypothetical protein N3B16_05040 [Candidatus Aminicenantes bacterium]|nr:hypothetical protein [Candidatus Aminicenantes bacterium]
MINLGLKLTRLLGLLALFFSFIANQAMAQQTFGTTIYFDYIYFLSDDGPITTVTAPGYRNNFFQFRRAYLTYENRIGDRLRFRFRFDADNTSNVTSVSFTRQTVTTDGKLRPYMKHLYFEISDFLLKNTRLRIGMVDTLTWKPSEDKWGYRSVAKTLVDIYRDVTREDIDATSADIGIWYGGSVNKYIRYAFMLASGNHYTRIENDKWKKLMGQLHLVPIAGLSLVGYIDYEKQNPTDVAYTYKLDIYFEMIRNLIIASEYFVYNNDLKIDPVSKQKYKPSGLSIFGRYTIQLDYLSLFARFDHFEPNNQRDNDQINLIIAGVDWAPFGTSIRFQPNIWLYQYEDETKKNDLIFQFTFFLSF